MSKQRGDEENSGVLRESISMKPTYEELAVQLANAESKCREMAAELSAVDKIHNEAVFITDDHYEQCPPEVQKMIRSLAVLQIPAYDAFLAEVRAQGVDYAIGVIEDCANNLSPGGTGEAVQYAQEMVNPYLDSIHDKLADKSAQLRKGGAA
ncbi:hypothetical protein [Citrobacter freundii]|uniref:hypothetical protein n=2 Tax=Citrobacter freundii TaxID=546 RepID=UPI003A8A5010